MHFLLMVIGENPEQQLAPYSAETVYTPQEDVSLTPESIIEHLQSVIPKLQLQADNPGEQEQPEALRLLLEDIMKLSYQEGVRHHLELFQSFMLDHYDCEVDDLLRPIRLHNPQVKFDHHVMGGRWRGMLKLHPGARGAVGPAADGGHARRGFADQCRREDLDLAGSLDAAIQEAGQRWDNEQKRAPKALPFDQKRDAYIEEAIREALIPEAIIADGQYLDAAIYAPDDWEAHVHRLLQDMPPDTLITLYDCHN